MLRRPSTKLSINHEDLLNLPKDSHKRKGKKNKEDFKKKNKGRLIKKGISPQFTFDRTNIDIFPETNK
jgi:hypothetical protein